MNARPLCVDLDGTLVTTDLLWEAWFSLVRRNTATALYALTKLLSGRAAFKSFVAEHVVIDPSALPYNEALLSEIRAAAAAGRHIALVTASPRKWAEAVAAHVKLFDEVMATDGAVNLKSTRKGRALVDAFGAKSFDYVGDSTSDVEVWKDAHSAWVVGAGSSSVARRAASVAHLERVIEVRRARIRDWLSALRLHQWVKNLLILVPILGAQQIGNRELLFASLAAVLCFCCVASANYVLNDLFDIGHDRNHPIKRRRALAAGLIGVPSAVLVMLSLFLAGGLIASRLPVPFMWTLALYALGALSYSLYFKRKAPMDTLVLAALYTLRVLAGNAATGIPPSFWLLAFSLFLFLSLAMSKRHAELMRLRGTAEEAVQGRDYWVADREMISQLGVSAGYISVLVLALYVNSPEAATQYERPAILWLLCVLVLFWITRLWLIAHRGQLHEDPVVFAIRDRTSQIAGILSLVLLYLAA